MTIQPPPSIERPAEQRPAPDPTAPRPHGWCHACGTPIQDSPSLTAERIANDLVGGPAFPLRVSSWAPEHLALVRAIAEELQLLADGAETYLART